MYASANLAAVYAEPTALRRFNTTNSPPSKPQAPEQQLLSSSTAPLSTYGSNASSNLIRSSSTRPPDKYKDKDGHERHHHRPHLHAHIPHHRPHYHHGREKKDNVPQSALLGIPADMERVWSERSALGEMLSPGVLKTAKSRSAGASPGGSAEGSRRGSLAAEIEREAIRRRKDKAITEKDVEREREAGRKREEELRTSLDSLATLSTIITRQLDYTYYNLLERLSSLYATLHSFQELSTISTKLTSDFLSDANSLQADTTRQINDFKSFESQGHQIEQLEDRLRRGRDKADLLAKRLDVVRERVGLWEKREGEWQRKTSRRLRYMWGAIVTAIVLLAILFFSHTLRVGHPGSRPRGSAQKGTPFVNRTIELGRAVPVARSMGFVPPEPTCGWMGKGVKGLPLAETEQDREKGKTWMKSRESTEDDPRLRIFDEL